jgi:galactokinase
MNEMDATRKVQNDAQARTELKRLARENGFTIASGRVCRTSSRFCLGVEHGDYNGTELFGVGTDRFIWLAYKPNGTDRIRLFSGGFPGDGVIEYRSGDVPAPRSPRIADTWARFPYGVDFILRREGLRPVKGFDAVLIGNIPGGGMSRSASLTLNLILTVCDVNGLDLGRDRMRIIDLAQAVENDYIGSPCGQLDQIMIYFARAGMGTHYNPATRSIRYVPLGPNAIDFRIVSMDTGTVRPGLEKSTYRIRREECETLARLAGRKFGFRQLADVRDPALYRKVLGAYGASHPDHCDRLRYIHEAQIRFTRMMKAWRAGDVPAVGQVFREDGWGLRDMYRISGPELETMCDIARTVPGVLGERMLGGGDKGASGALVRASAVKALRRAVGEGYPRSHPAYADSHALHECGIVDGVTRMPL